MKITETYLESVRKQFLYYKTIGEKAMHQLAPEQLFVMTNDDTNSIATIVKHLAGNMLSRWTDFLTTDGEKEWRNRDSEFENDLQTPEQVWALWNQGWACFLAALDSLSAQQLDQIIYIRNEGHTVMEAINRQLAHYPYHIGQIVFIGKMLRNDNWTSLSIPKGNSQEFNHKKFSESKQIQHFTDEYLQKSEKNNGV